MTPRTKAIVQEVAAKHRLPVRVVLNPVRRPEQWARQEVMYHLRQVRKPDGRHVYTLPQIAAQVGCKDHTTVLYAVRKVAERMGEEA